MTDSSDCLYYTSSLQTPSDIIGQDIVLEFEEHRKHIGSSTPSSSSSSSSSSSPVAGIDRSRASASMPLGGAPVSSGRWRRRSASLPSALGGGGGQSRRGGGGGGWGASTRRERSCLWWSRQEPGMYVGPSR